MSRTTSSSGSRPAGFACSFGGGWTSSLSPSPGARLTAALRWRQAKPKNRPSSAPSVSGRPARAVQESSQLGGRAVEAQEALERAALGRRHLRAAPHLEDRRELHQPPAVHEVGEPPAADSVAQPALAQAAHALGHAGHRRGRSVTQHRTAVLRVVVQRPVHIGDVAERQGREPQPVVVEVRELGRREGQRVAQQFAREERRGARDGVGHEQREQVAVVVAAHRPVGVGDDLAARVDDARVAVDQARLAHRREQRGQLVRVPVVVLVGHRDVRGPLRGQGQRALEVAVEAQAGRCAVQAEARVAGQDLPHAAEPLRRGGVVADHAHPVVDGLRANRVDLAAEEVERRLVGGHADRHLRRRVRGDRGVELGPPHSRQRDLFAVDQQVDRDLLSDRSGPDAYEAPEAAAVRALRRPVDRLHHVTPGHPERAGRLLVTVDQERQRPDRAPLGEAPAAQEQRRPVAGADLVRKGEVQAELQIQALR
jgi:hypothetical protein